MDPGPEGDLGLAYSGTVTFDMALKGQMTTRFHPRHADEVMRTDVGKALFIRENGWAVGEWDVSGSMTLPILIPSRKQVMKKAQEEATEQIKKNLPALEDIGRKLLKKFLK
jgi:hypothetical protein